MSWSFQLQKVNQSFEAIASWYHEFMNRTEACFRSMNQRLVTLEENQGPTDEQLERVLRKILAEKFSNGNAQRLPSIFVKEEPQHFVTSPRRRSAARPVLFDPAILLVNPESVPSQAYAETFNMLQSELVRYPNLAPKRSRPDDEDDQTGRSRKHPRT